MAEVSSPIQHTLVELAIAGERRAFDRLYQLWQARWYRFVLRQCTNPATAEDVLQNGVLEMVKNIGRLRDPQSFTAWSFVILRRACAMHVRRKVVQREKEASAVAAECAEEPAAPEDPRLTDLSVALTALSADQQNLLALFYSYGLSIAELAKVYEVPTGTIK